MLKIAVLIVFIFICFSSAHTQQININTSGDIDEIESKISFRPGQIIDFKIPGKDKFSKQEFNEIQKRINSLNALLNSTTEEHLNALKTIQDAYDYLKSNDVKSKCNIDYKEILKTQYDICDTERSIKSLDSINNLIEEAKPKKDSAERDIAQSKKTSRPISDCFDATCICGPAIKKIKAWGEAEKIIEDIIRKRELIIELLCETKDPSNVFKLEEGDNEKANGIIKFKNNTSELYPAIISTGYNYEIDNSIFTYRESDSSFNLRKVIGRKATFELKQTKPFNKTLIDWHNKAIKTLDRKEINALSEKVQKDKQAILNLEKWLTCNNSCNVDAVLALRKILLPYDEVWCPTGSIAMWLKKWLWFSGGELKLNYFNFSTSELLKETPKYQELMAEFKNNSTEEKNLDELQKKIDALKNCLSCDIKSLDTLQLLFEATEEVRKKRATPSTIKKLMGDNDSKVNKYATLSTTLHSFKLPVRDEKSWIIYHNALEDYELASLKKVILPEDYNVYFGVYNAKKIEEDALEFSQVKEEFKDNGRFVQEMTEAVKELADASLNLTPFYAPLNNILKATITNGKSLPKVEELYNKGLFHEPSFTDTSAFTLKQECDYLRLTLNKKLWRWKLLERMLEEYNALPTPDSIEVKEESQPLYYTYARKAKEFAAPYTNSYTIKYKTKEILSNRYSIGRLKIIGVGAGIFFNGSTARQVSIDTLGNTFKITNRDEGAKFVLGLKIYPWKSFAADDGFIPRYFTKRLNLFTGFEITKPLDNLYAGIGYDIVPGLQITTGYHFYKRNVYQVQNNQIIDQTSKYNTSGLYYGVTLDPGVLAGILKALIL